jgi:purine nucleoside permease
MSDEEGTGVMQGLSFLAHAGRARLGRVLILRAGSDYTIGPPGMTAADFLAKETHQGFPATPEALNALYLVASPVVAYLADNWGATRDTVPGAGMVR